MEYLKHILKSQNVKFYYTIDIINKFNLNDIEYLNLMDILDIDVIKNEQYKGAIRRFGDNNL